MLIKKYFKQFRLSNLEVFGKKTNLCFPISAIENPFPVPVPNAQRWSALQCFVSLDWNENSAKNSFNRAIILKQIQ